MDGLIGEQSIDRLLIHNNEYFLSCCFSLSARFTSITPSCHPLAATFS